MQIVQKQKHYQNDITIPEKQQQNQEFSPQCVAYYRRQIGRKKCEKYYKYISKYIPVTSFSYLELGAICSSSVSDSFTSCTGEVISKGINMAILAWPFEWDLKPSLWDIFRGPESAI